MGSTRRHIRFEPDPNTYVLVKVSDELSLSGLCLDESLSGCAAVFKKHEALVEKAVIDVKVGELELMTAEIRWLKEIDADVLKVGFEYLT